MSDTLSSHSPNRQDILLAAEGLMRQYCRKRDWATINEDDTDEAPVKRQRGNEFEASTVNGPQDVLPLPSNTSKESEDKPPQHIFDDTSVPYRALHPARARPTINYFENHGPCLPGDIVHDNNCACDTIDPGDSSDEDMAYSGSDDSFVEHDLVASDAETSSDDRTVHSGRLTPPSMMASLWDQEHPVNTTRHNVNTPACAISIRVKATLDGQDQRGIETYCYSFEPEMNDRNPVKICAPQDNQIVETMEDHYKALGVEMQKLRAENDTLLAIKAENAALKKRVKKSTAAHPDLAALQKENDRLQRELIAVGDDESAADTARLKLECLKKEHEHTVSAITEANDALHEKNDELTRANLILDENLKQSQAKLVDLEKREVEFEETKKTLLSIQSFMSGQKRGFDAI